MVVTGAAELLVVEIRVPASTASTAAAAAVGAAATATTGEGWQEVLAGVARRAGTGAEATGRGTGLGTFPLTAAVCRERRGVQ
jgi:hypothetical protein